MNTQLQKKEKPMVLVALGGHAFMQRGEKGTAEIQERNAAVICDILQTLVEREFNIVVTHGNGPQVGNLLLLNESGDKDVPKMPLDVLVAQTEGSLGYFLQQAMLNSLKKNSQHRYVVTVVTQVRVNKDDDAFKIATKPVGPFLTKEEAHRRKKELGWVIVEDSGRGWRRVVPSPIPEKVIQGNMIFESAKAGNIVIAAGGGGIPIVKKTDGSYHGVEAVIDKDLTSSILANQIDAEILIILTEVSEVYTGFGTHKQKAIGAITVEQLAILEKNGEFPDGSMRPKIRAVRQFLERGGKRAIITNPQTMPDALKGLGGTHIIGGY